MVRNFVILIVLGSLFIGCHQVRNNDGAEHIRIAKTVDSIFEQLKTDEIFNGEILIAQNRKIIFHKFYGIADLQSNDEFTNESVFEIASLSKPFTALAIAKLVADKKLSYSNELTKFLPELPYDKVTIQHLINHTSGLPDYSKVLYPVWDAERIANNQDLFEILKKNPPKLLHPPGTKWTYSNIGYTLLAIILERVQDLSFPEYCHENIFKPLNMYNTTIPTYNETKLISNYTNDFIFSYGTAKYIDPIKYISFDNATFTGDMYGAQGICTNATELYQFSNIFHVQQIIPDSLFKKYISPQNIETTMSKDFTSGWFYDRDSLLGETLFYAGGFSAHRSFIQYSSSEETLFVILSNTSAPIWSLREIIIDCINNKKIDYPKKSFVKTLSYQLKDFLNDKIKSENIISFDDSIYKYNDYEYDELIEELVANNLDNLAIIASEKVLEIDSGNFKPFLNIGNIKYSKGKIEESLYYYGKALELHPADEDLLRQINRIKEQEMQ